MDRASFGIDRLPALIGLLVGLAAAGGCLSELTPEPSNRIGALPEQVPVPEGSPLTPATVELGRLLFWDPILSGDRDVACATCHHPSSAYADGLDRSIGVGGIGLGPARRPATGAAGPVARNAPTVVNTAWNGIGAGQRTTDPRQAPMFWDNRTRSLEQQALEPIRSGIEMRGDAYPEDRALPVVLSRLASIPDYAARFEAAFGPGPITERQLAIALASYQRILVAPNTSFDRYARGDDAALTPAQKRGLRLFMLLGCNSCHSGPMFSDFELHQLGTDPHPLDPSAPEALAVRTPSLRHVARTAPYMHNGTLATLEDVMAFYQELSFGGREHADPDDPDLASMGQVTSFELGDLIAFMHALSDGTVNDHVPSTVPSNLPPGGNIGAAPRPPE